MQHVIVVNLKHHSMHKFSHQNILLSNVKIPHKHTITFVTPPIKSLKAYVTCGLWAGERGQNPIPLLELFSATTKVFMEIKLEFTYIPVYCIQITYAGFIQKWPIFQFFQVQYER